MTSGDSAALAARLRELAARAVERRSVEFTRFLDPREQSMAHAAAEEAGAGCTFSPPEGAERKVCAFDGRLWLDDDRRYDWPVLPLEILWDGRHAKAAHRDILGAVLALGIGRESVGDILVEEGRAVLWALDAAAAFILANLVSAGRATVRVRQPEGIVAGMPEAQTKQLRGTVQSLRLDAVVAEAFNLSREEAARAVKRGLVRVDYAEETKIDRKVPEGSLISVRGMGRARILDASEKTKRRGRTVVEFERTV